MPARRALPFILLGAPLLGASLPFPPEDPADIRKTEERIGAFRIEIEEHRPREFRSALAQHPPWTKVRLIWRSGDGLTELTVEDDGHTLRRRYSVRRPNLEIGCFGGGGLSDYSRGPATARFWQSNRREYVKFLESCPHVPPFRRPAYEAEHRQALADFPAALERLKGLALAAFGGLAPRCIQFKYYKYDEPDCKRFSKWGKRP